MDTKDYCKSVLEAGRAYDRHKAAFKRKRKEQKISLLRSPSLDGLPHTRGYKGNYVFDKIEKLVDEEADETAALINELADLIELQLQFDRLVCLLPVDNENRALYLKYAEGKRHSEIAEELNLSEYYIQCLIRSGRKNLQRVLDAWEAGEIKPEDLKPEAWEKQFGIRERLFPEFFREDDN